MVEGRKKEVVMPLSTILIVFGSWLALFLLAVIFFLLTRSGKEED